MTAKRKATPKAPTKKNGRAPDGVLCAKPAEDPGGLGALRRKLGVPQATIAKALGIGQGSVSALESRLEDVKLTTLKRYVEALGAKLTIAAFIDGRRIMLFEDGAGR